ncbi:M1 family metallopeptidase [Pedobacter sp. BS3]|nr:M1 family metallopeptidase [Pedobacter sp. BS3]
MGFLLAPVIASAQSETGTFTRADTLRGAQSPERTCYDITYYHLDVQLDINRKTITGSNLFQLTATRDFNRLQFDLFSNLEIDSVVYQHTHLPVKREYNAVFIEFPGQIPNGSMQQFTVFYHGQPVEAKSPPWDGGLVFSKDAAGKPWVSVACQGFGASCWWPNKDQQADEADSMLISITAPQNLSVISNGRLRSAITDHGLTKHNWFVSNPINNYDVTFYIGDYIHFNDVYQGVNGPLTLDYYVLKENLAKAKKQFSANVNPMLRCFEHWFGAYPFYKDGYKLVDAPYFGMEHQSAVAYGNDYKNGYRGSDLSGTGLGLSWDYIIIHESGHEWFGNSITAKDIADMWIHEAFTMYAEGLFVECNKGKEAGAAYIAGLRKNVLNDKPIIGPYGVNTEGSSDMYYKGANMLQTIRSVINDDSKWLAILRGLNQQFGHKTTTTAEVIAFINRLAGKNLTNIFDQYLRYTRIPDLQIRKAKNGTFTVRWKVDVADFNMPIKVKYLTSGNWHWIYPTTSWQTIKPENAGTKIIPDTKHFYITVNGG